MRETDSQREQPLFHKDLLPIHLLVLAQFGSCVTPLVIMAAIPLTLIGVMPGGT